MATKGDHIWVWRKGYKHHGIDLGDGSVAQYSGLADGLRSGPVSIVPMRRFRRGKRVHTVLYKHRPYSSDETCVRARSRVGEECYSFFANNCEHFARWCVTGEARSQQVERGVGIANKAQAVASGAGAVGIVSKTGTVVGLSAPGIASSLAALGPGGMTGGVATLAGGAGLGSVVLLNNTVFADNEGLEKRERDARRAARKGTVAGAAAATAGGVGTISATGTVTGLSGPGIMSGLAAIGTKTGVAAMTGASATVAGTAAVVAAPVVAAAAVGAALYWFFK